MPCYCYILECSDGTFYTGWTTDLEQRLSQHNRGSGGRYTRSRRPVRLVYSEQHADKSSAMQRELQIKKMTRITKEKLVNQK